jgi:hypothetical protein
MESLIGALVGAISTIVAVAVTAKMTPVIEEMKGAVAPLPDGRLRVSFRALRRRNGMWLVPNYGVLNIGREHMKEAEYQKFRVCFICRDTTPADDYFQQYTVERVVVVA